MSRRVTLFKDYVKIEAAENRDLDWQTCCPLLPVSFFFLNCPEAMGWGGKPPTPYLAPWHSTRQLETRVLWWGFKENNCVSCLCFLHPNVLFRHTLVLGPRLSWNSAYVMSFLWDTPDCICLKIVEAMVVLTQGSQGVGEWLIFDSGNLLNFM